MLVDKELYGDTFRRPARLSPLEAKALLRALDVVAPLIAAEAHTALAAVREKVRRRSATYSLRDTPSRGALAGRGVGGHVLNQAVRDRRVARISYLSRSSGEYSNREIEPHLLRRDESGWYVEAWDRSKEARRTFKVQYIKRARAPTAALQPRPEMADLTEGLGGEVGVARVLVTSGAAPSWSSSGATTIEPAREGGAVAAVPYGSDRWLRLQDPAHRGEAEVLGPRAAPARGAAPGRGSAQPADAGRDPLTLASATRALRCRCGPSRSGTYSRR